MNELIAPDMALGALALAAAIFYCVRHEARAKNVRDAKLLAVIGAASLLGGAAAWLY